MFKPEMCGCPLLRRERRLELELRFLRLFALDRHGMAVHVLSGMALHDLLGAAFMVGVAGMHPQHQTAIFQLGLDVLAFGIAQPFRQQRTEDSPGAPAAAAAAIATARVPPDRITGPAAASAPT